MGYSHLSLMTQGFELKSLELSIDCRQRIQGVRCILYQTALYIR
jgi:hypothetical protein